MSQATRPWQVGEALAEVTLPPVTRLDLIRYAGASGDYNPIHTIDEEAHRAGLPGVIQHGMLTMAQIGRLLSPHLDEGWILRFQTRFRGMVFVGESLRIGGKVTAVESVAGGEKFTFELTAQTGEGRTIATAAIDFLHEGGGAA